MQGGCSPRNSLYTKTSVSSSGVVPGCQSPKGAGLAAHVLSVPAEVESDILRRVRTLLRELDGHHPACQSDRGKADPGYSSWGSALPPGPPHCIAGPLHGPKPHCSFLSDSTRVGGHGVASPPWPCSALSNLLSEVLNLCQAPGVCRAPTSAAPIPPPASSTPFTRPGGPAWRWDISHQSL